MADILSPHATPAFDVVGSAQQMCQHVISFFREQAVANLESQSPVGPVYETCIKIHTIDSVWKCLYGVQVSLHHPLVERG